MNESFGSEVIHHLNSLVDTAPIRDLVDWNSLKTADKANVLTRLFGEEAASKAEYQTLTAAEAASLLAKIIEALKKQRDATVNGSMVEGVINVRNGIA